MAPETCPNCGADIPSGAKSCPECGADEHTGWSEEAYASGLNLPEQEFNYDEFVEREFGKKQRIKPHGVRWFWWVAAILVVILFVLGYLKWGAAL